MKNQIARVPLITSVCISILGLASSAYSQSLDGEWRGMGKCSGTNIPYSIQLNIQTGGIAGGARSLSIGRGPAELKFVGQIDAASGKVAVSEAFTKARYVGSVGGRRMTFGGWSGEADCHFTLDQINSTNSAAPPAKPQPLAPSPSVTTQSSAPTPRPAPEASSSRSQESVERDASVTQRHQEVTASQRALGALGYFRGTIDGVYGPNTSAAIETWQRSQGLPSTGYLTIEESDRLKQQALAQLGGWSAPSIGAQPIAPKPQTAEAEPRSATPTSTIKVGTVFWLSTKGVGRTVVAVTVPQAGLVNIDYRITPANASEVCQRQDQLQPGTPSHRACVEKTLTKSGQVESLIVNCGTRAIASGGELYRRNNDTPLRRDGNEGFWWGTNNKNHLLRGDEVFRLTCGLVGHPPKSSSDLVAPPKDLSVVTSPPPPEVSPQNRIEWAQLYGAWVPQSTYNAERCSGNSPYPPPDNFIAISRSGIAHYERGCDIETTTRTSESSFTVAMRCGEFNDRSQPRNRTFALANGRLVVDGSPHVRCSLPGFGATLPSAASSRP